VRFIAAAASCTIAFLRRAAVLEREVVALEVDLEPDDLGRGDAQRFDEQFLSGLVAFEHDDRGLGHGPAVQRARRALRSRRTGEEPLATGSR
jgi:hypothetical protein